MTSICLFEGVLLLEWLKVEELLLQLVHSLGKLLFDFNLSVEEDSGFSGPRILLWKMSA